MQYYLGEIRIFGGGKVPEGWALCDGSLLSINENPTLFELLQTNFGGDGRSTFGLPNLIGKVPVGQGQGGGLSNRALAQTGGSKEAQLTSANLPAHSHNVMVSTSKATASTAGGSMCIAAPSVSEDVLYIKPTVTQTPASDPMNPQTIGTIGSGQPHGNMMPTVALSYIIALQGEFPAS